MDTEKVSSRPCDASQAYKVAEYFESHGIHIFPRGRIKTEVSLAYRCKKGKEPVSTSEIIEALDDGLRKLGINDGTRLDICKDDLAKEVDKILLLNGLTSAKFKIKFLKTDKVNR